MFGALGNRPPLNQLPGKRHGDLHPRETMLRRLRTQGERCGLKRHDRTLRKLRVGSSYAERRLMPGVRCYELYAAGVS